MLTKKARGIGEYDANLHCILLHRSQLAKLAQRMEILSHITTYVFNTLYVKNLARFRSIRAILLHREFNYLSALLLIALNRLKNALPNLQPLLLMHLQKVFVF